MNLGHNWSQEVIDPSDKLMSHDLAAGQCCGQKIGLHLIVFSSGLNDGLIHLNNFFRVVGAVISINVASLELVWPPDLFERPHQSTESTFSHWSNALH
jgi:hypothetical protein